MTASPNPFLLADNCLCGTELYNVLALADAHDDTVSIWIAAVYNCPLTRQQSEIFVWGTHLLQLMHRWRKQLTGNNNNHLPQQAQSCNHSH